MTKVVTIAFNDLRIYFSQRGNFIGLVLIPIILAAVLGFTSVPPATRYTLDIVDLDETETSQQMIDALFAANERFVRSDIDVTVDEARLRVAEETVEAALVIPKNFASDLRNFEAVHLRYFSNEGSMNGAIQPGIMSVIGRWNAAVIASRSGEIVVDALAIELTDGEIYERAVQFIEQEPVRYDFSLTNTERALQPGEGFGQSVPGFGAMFVMFTVFGGMAALLRERKHWTMQRIIVMPVTRSQVIGGKILTYFTLGMIQFLILFSFGQGCKESGCALIGGETAEMPGMYEGDDYDLAGFVVGVVDKTKVIDGSNIEADQTLIGVASSGPHSNGYSLIRKIVDDTQADLNQPFDGSTLGKKLLAPTQLYVKPILNILQNNTQIHGIAHITGGGIMENISRVMPEGIAIEVNQHSWKRPAVFEWLQQQGNIEDIEMLRTFNCGIGLCVVVDNDDAADVIKQFKAQHINAWNIGKTTPNSGQEVIIK